MNYSDKFGLKNVYYYNGVPDGDSINKDVHPIKDLKEYIVNNGFKGYCSKGISSYFTFRYPIVRLTMFDNISRLDAGTVIINNKIYPYWRLVLVKILQNRRLF